MRVAVTGGTGFVGSHLADALCARGDTVTCLVRTAAAGAPLEALGCRNVLGTLGDDRALARLVSDAEVVYHVAGLVSLGSPDARLRVNRDGTARVAAAARTAGVRRLLYVSSLAVTGSTVPGRPLDETGAPRPVTIYGRAAPLGLWLSGRRQSARHVTFLMMITFYLCYAAFLLFPVTGPSYIFPQADNAATAVLPARLTQRLLNGNAAWGTAFGILLFVPAVLLTFGTVYGQFHYASDAIAGSVLAAVLLAVTRKAS